MKQVEHATRIVIADERAAEEGRGAFMVDGKMIDAPEVGKAHALLARAKQCRVDIDAVREIFKNQIID
jgi:citrate lyase subunit beta-like protein